MDRLFGHVEHYAHNTDFVALWGVLHFASTAPKSRTIPRFIGRVFTRSSARGGHQFCQHYLDGMFPLARDPDTGALTGCADDGNEFMESSILVGREGDESADVNEALARAGLPQPSRAATATTAASPAARTPSTSRSTAAAPS